jgi:hypothetical protein
MKKPKITKSNWITLGIILIIIILVIFAYNKPVPETSEEVAKCIGSKSELYIQLGCHACDTQEKIFGENYKYLNTIDCFYEREKCSNIKATPTWIINGDKYLGVQSIEKIRELTKC